MRSFEHKQFDLPLGVGGNPFDRSPAMMLMNNLGREGWEFCETLHAQAASQPTPGQPARCVWIVLMRRETTGATVRAKDKPAPVESKEAVPA